MKKFLLLCTFFLAHLLVSSQSLPYITLEGDFYDDLSQQGLAYQSFQVSVMDSNGGLIYQDFGYSDSMGHFSYVVTSWTPINNLPGTLEILDCRGTVFVYNFNTGPANHLESGIDFYLCPRLPAVAARWIYGNATGNTPVSFIDESGPIAFAWAWDFGDGATSNLQNPTHTYAANGNYNVCLTVTGVHGITSTFCDTARVGGTWQGPWTASLHYGEISPGIMGFTVTTNSIPKATGYYFSGLNSNYFMSYTNSLAYIYTGNGSPLPCVDVHFTDSSGASACLLQIPNGPCQADFYSMPDPSGQYSLLIVNNSFGNDLTYAWDFGDGATSTLQFPQHTYAGAGLYNLCLTVVDSSGQCTRTFCDSIMVSNKVSTPFTIRVVSALTTAVAESTPQLPTIACYPNPAQDQVTVAFSLTTAANVGLQILDLQGRVMRAVDANKYSAGMHEFSLSLGDLPAGLYLVRTVIGEQQVVKKLMLAR